MNKAMHSVLALLFASPLFAAPVNVPDETVIVHDIQFSDPKGNSDTTGGNAYDREFNQIGTNKLGPSNQALAAIIPPKAAQYVQFQSDVPSIASVSSSGGQSPQTLSVSGLLKGKANVTSARLPSKKLQDFDFTPFQRTIALHIISDTAGHTAGLSVAQVQAIVTQVNLRWGGQGNITFGPNPIIDQVTVPIDLGPAVVMTNVPSTDEQAILNAAKSVSVGFNVYFVNLIDASSAGGGFPSGVTRPGTTDSFVSVAPAPSRDINRSTAHELGHGLRLSRAAGTADYEDAARIYQLMYGFDGGGFTITPTQADIINPTQ